MADHPALGEIEIKQLPFNSGILVDLLGKAIPNIHFIEIFFSQFWLKRTYAVGSQTHTENKGFSTSETGNWDTNTDSERDTNTDQYSEIPILTACY